MEDEVLELSDGDIIFLLALREREQTGCKDLLCQEILGSANRDDLCKRKIVRYDVDAGKYYLTFLGHTIAAKLSVT